MLKKQMVAVESKSPGDKSVASLAERQRLIYLNGVLHELVFTDVQKAQKYLSEIKLLLQEIKEPDSELSYYINTALVENLLYNYTLSERTYQKTIELLRDRGNLSQLAETLIDYAGLLFNLEKLDLAFEMLTEVEKILASYPDFRLQARLFCRQGYLQLKKPNYAKALHLFLESEKQFNLESKPLDLKDYYFFCQMQSGLGSIYSRNQEYDKSIKAYKKVVKLCEKKGMRSRLSWHYLNLGNELVSSKDYHNAIDNFKSALKVIDDVNLQARAMVYANLGLCYFEEGLYTEALKLMSKAYPLFKDQDDGNLANIEWWRAKIFKKQDKVRKAFKYIQNAIRHSNLAGDYKQLSMILRDISTWCAESGDFKNAYEYQKKYEEAIEHYFLEEKDSQIREIQIKYETEKKEKEAEMFKLQAIGLQLKALRVQMNPHFVFNALNSIQNYITSNDTTSAAKYLAQFAHLMRQSLEYSELEFISLESEIEFLRNYLEINEKLRFESKLSFEIEIDEEIEEDIYGVPTMIIQPFVENAIEHGIRPKKNGLIRVLFKHRDDASILCIVEDNGIGREKAAILQGTNNSYKKHRSLGTKITQERLEILLKSKNRKEEAIRLIDLKDEITGEPRGTKVEILIPIVEIQIK